MQEKKLKLSRWCKSFVRGDVMALFHALNLNLIFLPLSKGEGLLQIAGDSVDGGKIEAELGQPAGDLVAAGFLVETNNQDDSLLESLREDALQDAHLDLCYLLLTDGCNLRCRYCFEDTPAAPGFQERHMSSTTIVRGLEMFAKVTAEYGGEDSTRVIHLYGGEPLLNSFGVRMATEVTENLVKSGRLPKNTELVIVTNGTLMTLDMAQFLADHRVTVGISLDGPQCINDLYRMTRKGEGAFERARNAYRLVQAAGARAGVSVTLTPEAVQNFDEVLSFLLEELRVREGLSFNILHFNPRSPVGDEYYREAANCLLRAFEVFRGLGIYEERMMRKARAFVNKEPIFADCGVTGSQIVIAPDGRVGVCQDFVKPRTYFTESAFDDTFDPVKRGMFNEWKKRSPFFMDACIDCEAIAICGGGCAASAELQTGSRWNVDKRICPHSKLSLEWLIWQTYLQLD